mgnify:CR=1 FL=1
MPNLHKLVAGIPDRVLEFKQVEALVGGSWLRVSGIHAVDEDTFEGIVFPPGGGKQTVTFKRDDSAPSVRFV